jgi:hypothetical protein
MVALSGVLALGPVGPALGEPLGDAEAGKYAWSEKHDPPQATASEASGPRSCARCHTDDLTQPGKHAITGEPIEPMAPSVNPKRLASEAKIAKWFGRNCRWVLGRACTDQEKADFLAYIRSQ